MAAPKPSGFANTKAGKAAILERTKNLLDQSQLVIALPIEGVSKEQVDFLRKEIPKTTKASVVKNSLMRKAVEGTTFAPIAEGLRDENMFLFIPEGEARPTYEGVKKWMKEVKRTDPEFQAKVAVMEGQKYTKSSIEAVANLPTKKELIAKIAIGIKAVPTRVAKGVKAVPSKVGRAFGALKNKLEEEAKGPAEV
jgi:large subunit ribosomal protein L10